MKRMMMAMTMMMMMMNPGSHPVCCSGNHPTLRGRRIPRTELRPPSQESRLDSESRPSRLDWVSWGGRGNRDVSATVAAAADGDDDDAGDDGVVDRERTASENCPRWRISDSPAGKTVLRAAAAAVAVDEADRVRVLTPPPEDSRGNLRAHYHGCS